MPDEFYRDLWSAVARVDKAEIEARGLRLREIKADAEGNFHFVD